MWALRSMTHLGPSSWLWGALLAAVLIAPIGVASEKPASAGARLALAAASSAGFTDTAVYSVSSPTALASTPDGRLLITQDAGQLRVVRDGNLVAAPAVNLQSRTCSEGERGLNGVAVDPGFATNHFVYLHWTYNKFGFCGVDSAQSPVTGSPGMCSGTTTRSLPAPRRSSWTTSRRRRGFTMPATCTSASTGCCMPAPVTGAARSAM